MVPTDLPLSHLLEFGERFRAKFVLLRVIHTELSVHETACSAKAKVTPRSKSCFRLRLSGTMGSRLKNEKVGCGGASKKPVVIIYGF